MYHPTTRVLTILELLQSHPEMSGPDIAARLEVDVRTVRRYVMMLQDLGIPVEGERGRYGTYRLRPGFKMPPLILTEDEALAITLGLLVARRLGLTSAAPATEGALAKVERVMPDTLRSRLQAVQESLIIQPPWFEEEVPTGDVVVAFGVAVYNSRRVWIRYGSRAGEETTREFDPYGLVYRIGRWYAAGYCHLRQDIRVFRLDRVVEVHMLDTGFTRPADFDAMSEVARSLAITPGIWPIEILLKTTSEHAERIIPAEMALLEATPEGIVMRCHVQRLGWFAGFLTELDCEMVIRRPAELREELGRLAERAAKAAQTV